MRQWRRVGAYGVLADARGRVLLVRGAAGSPYPGVWRLPGAALEHAEHPVDALTRAFAAQTRLPVGEATIRAAIADVAVFAAEGVALHTDRLVFDVTAADGGPRPDGAAGCSGLPPASTAPEDVAWCTRAEAAALPLMPFTAEALGLPVSPLPPGLPRALPATVSAPTADRRTRFAAYGLVTDPAGRVLLTLIAEGYPGTGLWHLPGGGTDHGEQPAAGLLRELVEETDQLGRVLAPIAVHSLHDPAERGPEGRLLDWHGVRVIYRVAVDDPTEARVTELAGGSTADAAWFAPEQLSDLRVTEVVTLALGHRAR